MVCHNPLEREIEKKVKEYAQTKGWIARKWVSPGHSFVPDGILLNHIPPEHREIVARYVKFVEFKQLGKKPTAGQQREHDRLRSHGYCVEVIDNVDDGKKLINENNQ